MYALYSDEVYDDIALCNAVGIAARTIKPRDKTDIVTTENLIKLYPNPSAGDLFIILPSIQVGSTILITDLLGRVLLSEKLSNTTNNLKLEVAEGVYQVQISQEGSTLYNNKIVIVKP